MDKLRFPFMLHFVLIMQLSRTYQSTGRYCSELKRCVMWETGGRTDWIWVGDLYWYHVETMLLSVGIPPLVEWMMVNCASSNPEKLCFGILNVYITWLLDEGGMEDVERMFVEWHGIGKSTQAVVEIWNEYQMVDENGSKIGVYHPIQASQLEEQPKWIVREKHAYSADAGCWPLGVESSSLQQHLQMKMNECKRFLINWTKLTWTGSPARQAERCWWWWWW